MTTAKEREKDIIQEIYTRCMYFYKLSLSYIDINWFDEAQNAIQQSLRLSQFCNMKKMDLGRHYYVLGWLNWHKKNYENALLNLDFIPESSRMYDEAQILTSIVEISMGDIASAKIKLEELYNKPQNQQNTTLLTALGDAYKELKMFKSALVMYHKGLKIKPKSYEFLYNISIILYNQKKYVEAIEYLLKFKETFPFSIEAHLFLANSYYKLGEMELAWHELEILLELDINSNEGYFLRAVMLNDKNEPLKAAKDLKSAIKLAPNRAKYYIEMSRSYELLGDLEAALMYVQEAFDIEPQNIEFAERAIEISKKMKDGASAKFYSNHKKRLQKLIKD